MVKCGVLFEEQTEFLNIIYTNFGFKGLSYHYESVTYYGVKWIVLD